MGPREVSVTVAGVVAGVIIAGGALTLGNAPLSGSVVDVAFRPVPENIRNASRRYIDETGVRGADPEVWTYPTTKDEIPVEPQEPLAAPTSCETAEAIGKEMRSIHKTVLPREPAVRRELDAAVNGVVAGYCATSAAASSSSSVVRRDNDCEKYARGSLRRTQCEINESLGRPYRGY